MASFCLLPEYVDKFKNGLRDGSINPQKLAEMTSEQRNKYLSDFVGKDSAKQVNALFESKLLLQNQKAGMIAWAKKVAGLSPEAKRDLIAKIERLDKVLTPDESDKFLKDLVETRLGVGVSEKEAKDIFDLTQTIKEKRAKADDNFEFSSKDDKLEFGLAQVAFEDYMNDLKLQSRKISFSEQPLKFTTDLIGKGPGVLKSLLSSLDNSFFGRQGIKTLLDVRTSGIWAKNFIKSFGDIGKELAGIDALKTIKADVYSRPNALNGKYKAGGYGLDVLSEEAFPSSLPARIPLLGRIFKASEAAYNGAALRMRADLADRYIAIAEKHGLNMLDKKEAQGLGSLIGSLTGRAGGKTNNLTNALLFSVKFLKANFNTLTAHSFDPKASSFAKSEARKNLVSMTASVAAMLSIAKALDPDSVEEDPRSTNFGKIKVFGRWVDITGGMAPMVTLAARLAPTYHNGQWGFWSKGKNGAFTDLTGGKYGQDDALDTLENFFEGKLSPGAGLLRDIWKGENYSGEPITPESALKGATIPLPIQTFEDMMKDPNATNIFASMMLEGLGFSGSQQTFPTDWDNNSSQEIQNFKELVGEDGFNKANDEFNKQYNDYLKQTMKSEKFKAKSDDDKKAELTKGREQIRETIFEDYGFKNKIDWDKNPGVILEQFKQSVGEEKFKQANSEFNKRYLEWFNKVRKSENYTKLSDKEKTELNTRAKDTIKQVIFDENDFVYDETLNENSDPLEALLSDL